MVVAADGVYRLIEIEMYMRLGGFSLELLVGTHVALIVTESARAHSYSSS